jgi:hypothetical protein
MVDGEKILTDVQFDAVTVRAKILQDGEQFERRMAIAHARTAGVGVARNGGMDTRTYDLLDGLVDNAVAKGSGQNLAFFWIAYHEGPVGTPRVRIREELRSDLEKIRRHV